MPDGNPSFWGGYIEAGYFLTGETRGYKNGTWDRTKVLKPFSKGGWGAFQINGRVDYLDLDCGKLHEGFNNNFLTGACSGLDQLHPRRQAARPARRPDLDPRGLCARAAQLLARLRHQAVRSRMRSRAWQPTIQTPPTTDYGVDVVQMRFQIDF